MAVDEMIVKWSMDSNNFNDGLKKMNKSMDVLKSEFKATSSYLNNFGTATDKLKNKQEYLTKTMELQNAKVEALRKAYEKQKDETGENSEEAQKLAIQLNNAISYYNSLEGQLKTVNNQLDNQKTKWEKVSETLTSTGNKLQNIGGKVSDVGNKLTLGVTAPLVGLATLSTVAYSELDQTQRKTKVIFGEMAKDVQEWSLANERNFGLGSGTIEKYTGAIADITQGMGLGKEASLEMSKGVVELGVQLGNWGGTSATASMEDLQKAISGGHEAVEKYGIKLNDAVLNQYAMNMGLGDSFSKLDEATKAQVRYEAILGSSQNAINYWNEGNRSTAFHMTEIKEQTGNISENIGKVLMPTVLEMTKKAGDFTAKLAQWSSENPKLMETIVKLGGAIAIIGPVISIFGKLTSGIGSTLKFVGGLNEKFKLLKQSTLITSAATKIMAIAQGTLNLIMSLNPITLVIAGLVALGATFVILYNKCEWFRNGVQQIWQMITSVFTSFNNFLTGIFTIDWTQSFGAFGNILNAFFTNVNNIWESIKKIFSGIIDFIAGVFTGDWSRAWGGVVNIFGGIMDGLGAVIKAPLNAVIGLINMAITQLNKISFTAPDWIPIVGGKHFGVNLPKINYLYEGGIIDRPTFISPTTVVGDAYKGMGRQAEAVIPLDKMYRNIRSIVREETREGDTIIYTTNIFKVDGKELIKETTKEVIKATNKKTKNYKKNKGEVAYA